MQSIQKSRLFLLNQFLKKRVPFILCTLFFMFLSNLSIAEDYNSKDQLLTPPVFTRDQFVFSYGRVGVGNDFISRKSSTSQALFECAASNTITRLKSIDVDYESYYCNLILETSIYKNRISLQSAFFRTGGGVFDSAIESFHEAFTMPNGSRGRTEENRYSASVMQGEDSISLSKTSLSFVDPQISISREVFEFSESSKLFFDISSTIPLNESDYSLSSPEIKLSLIFDSRLSSDFAYLFGVSGIYHSDRRQHGLEYNSDTVGFFLTTQWDLSDSSIANIFSFFESTTFFTQNVFSTNNQESFTNLYWYYWYLDVGFRVHTLNDQFFEIILRENPSPGSGTVDVSLILRYIF